MSSTTEDTALFQSPYASIDGKPMTPELRAAISNVAGFRAYLDWSKEPTTIYTASKTKHAARWQALRAAGHRVISTWIDEAGPGDTPDFPDLAARCIAEASRADVTLLYCEPGEVLKGALMEVGAALANGRQVRCVGSCDSLSPVFNQHPGWTFYPTVEEALAAA